MKKTDAEKRFVSALSHSVPNVLDAILSACDEPRSTQPEREVIMMTKKTNKRAWIASLGAVAAAIFVIAVGGFTYMQNYRVDSIIGFDVNPSIQLKTNRSDRVLEATPLNEDAKTILEGMELESANVNTAVNAIVGSMLKNGYIDELANSMLISVENDDPAKSEALRLKLVNEINSLLAASAVQPALLSQSVTETDEIAQIATQYGISRGKAKLIKSVADNNINLTTDALAPLTINEINLLAKGGEHPPEGIDSTGEASKKAYITDEKALAAALKAAGVKKANATGIEIDFDYDDGFMVYEVDFFAGGKEYDYEIDAKTGKVLHVEKKTTAAALRDEDEKVDTNPQSALIGKAKAKNIALKHAGVKSTDYIRVKLDMDDGLYVYDIDFRNGAYEYDYEINAKSGDIMQSERERIDNDDVDADERDDEDEDDVPSSKKTTSSKKASASSGKITQSKARSIALNHAGVKNPIDFEISLDNDDGMQLYEIDFEDAIYEYSYEINAKNGNIVSREKERKDD